MRRFVPFVLAALLTIGFISPVAAGRPDVFPQEPIFQEFLNSCEFDVQLQDSFAGGKILFFPQLDDGTQPLVATGGFASTLWRADDPDTTIEVKYFGHLSVDFLPDGNIRVRQSGTALWWFEDPADAGMFGLDPGIYLITGTLEVLVDETFMTLAPVDMKTTRVRDLCAELAV